MVYDRGGYYNRSEEQDYGRDYGSGRDYGFSSAREYQAAGELGGGRREGGFDRERMNRGRGGQMTGGGYDRGFDERRSDFFQGGSYRGGAQGGGSYGAEPYRGSYASDGHRFTEVDRDDDDRGYGRDRSYGAMGGGRGDDRGDGRGFFERAGEEVRSWFGGDDRDRGYRGGGAVEGGRRVSGNWDGDRVHDHRDRHYHEWRQNQISQLDRDYDEYRREHQSKFDNEFSSWRTTRQSQRQMLNQVEEHAEVYGSDGERVGTVDKIKGDRIVLTKNDPEAGGHHHSIPCGWLQSAEGNRVTLNKSSIKAKTMWRDEEYRNEGMFGGGRDGREHTRSDQGAGQAGGQSGGMEPRDNQGRMLNRSFSGTYEEK
jgi:hypothetical protein